MFTKKARTEILVYTVLCVIVSLYSGIAIDKIKGLLLRRKYTTNYTKPMTNDLIKEELGRSTWTLLHTLAAKYPEEPTPELRKDVNDFIYLLGRLYPCSQCSQHFQGMLQNWPPELKSGTTFSKWLCFLHNKVNKRLNKKEFDCNRLNDRWDCGCTDNEKKVF